MSKDQILELINDVAFFSDFSAEEKATLAGLDDVLLHKKAGEVVIEKGNTEPIMYFVLEGQVAITGGDNNEYEITLLEKGALFGDVPFVKAAPRLTSVIAKDDAALLQFNGAMLRNLGPAMVGKFKDQFLNLFVMRLDMLKSTISQNRMDFEKFYSTFQTLSDEIGMMDPDIPLPRDEE